MPVHDAMYTHSTAAKLCSYTNPHTDQAICDELDAVMQESLAASSAAARAVVHFFNVLEIAMNSANDDLAAEARRIFSSSYNAEVA
jgi:hypothetical protein